MLATRPLGDQLEFGYDYLIMAAGVQQSYFGHDEYAQWAPGMKTIEHALVIRRRVFGAFEMADLQIAPPRHATYPFTCANITGPESSCSGGFLGFGELPPPDRHFSETAGGHITRYGRCRVPDAMTQWQSTTLALTIATGRVRIRLELPRWQFVHQPEATGPGKVPKYERAL